MAMLDNTDIDFTDMRVLPGKKASAQWRYVTRRDLLLSGLGVGVLAAIMVYGLLNNHQKGVHLVVFIGVWIFLIWLQARRFLILRQKYRTGREIPTSRFADIRAEREAQ